MTKGKDIVKGEVVLELSKEDKETAQSIKDKLKKTAETIIEIGEKITKALEGKEKKKGYKALFYKEIGISDRTAQRYIQIAKNEKVLELKRKDELAGKTMVDLLQIIAPDTTVKQNTIDVKKAATGFYSRYKSEPENLKKIIEELQRLLEQADSE